MVVEEVEGNPGYYRSTFLLRPHYQLEGLTVSLRIVSAAATVVVFSSESVTVAAISAG